jgi:nicotinate-nucleotide adenylyltransferase
MRIGILGGSFDPAHYGHLLLAETCREWCHLDEVWLVPAAVPPHKLGNDRAPDAQRFEMLQLAIGGHPSITASDVELRRGGLSYTVDTLRSLRSEQPKDELFLLMGADCLHDLPNWREPEVICELACLVVVARLGSQPVDLDLLSGIATDEQIARFRDHLVEMPLIELSSTEIRRRVRQRRSIRYRTPRAVEKYIQNEGLYR